MNVIDPWGNAGFAIKLLGHGGRNAAVAVGTSVSGLILAKAYDIYSDRVRDQRGAAGI